MSGAALVLYVDRFWISPYVLSSFVALTEKGVPFSTRSIDLSSGEQRQAAYAGRALTARVPALEHGDFVLTESSAIAEYLDDVFRDRPRLLPKDPKQRARAREVMAWVRSDALALREERPTSMVFYPPPASPPPLSPAAPAAAAKAIEIGRALIKPGATSAFGTWCLADVDLAMMLARLFFNRDPLPDHLAAYVADQWQRPSVRSFVDHPRDPYVPY